MTDNVSTAPGPGAVSNNIRAELARAGQTAEAAQHRLGMGESAWRSRMTAPRRWTIGELYGLAKWLHVDISELIK